jgi:hypothetical protein
VKIETNREHNVGYLSLCEIGPGEVACTMTVTPQVGPEPRTPSINLDFDSKGALLGIEFLDAETGMARLRSDLTDKEM